LTKAKVISVPIMYGMISAESKDIPPHQPAPKYIKNKRKDDLFYSKF